MPSATVIIHRDRDCLSEEEILKEKTELGKHRIKMFVTRYYDIEGYFLIPQHINYLYPQIDLATAEALISDSTNEVEDISIGKLTNYYARDKKTDAATASQRARREYMENIERRRYTKEIESKVAGKIQEIYKVSGSLIKPSQFISVDKLSQLRS